MARSIWLISFTDLMCLLLAFFVLVFSMSEPEQHHWQAVAQSLTARQLGTRPGAVFNVSVLDPQSPINLDYLGTLLISQFASNAELTGIVPIRQDDRVVIGLPDSQLFDANQTAFSARGRQVLFVLGGVLGRISNRIEITGHAGLEPSRDDSERDPWELALARALAVGTALHQAGYQRQLAVRSVAIPPTTVYQPASGAPHRHPPHHQIDVVVRDLDEGT